MWLKLGCSCGLNSEGLGGESGPPTVAAPPPRLFSPSSSVHHHHNKRCKPRRPGVQSLFTRLTKPASLNSWLISGTSISTPCFNFRQHPGNHKMPPLLNRSNSSCVDVDFTLRRVFKKEKFRYVYGHIYFTGLELTGTAPSNERSSAPPLMATTFSCKPPPRLARACAISFQLLLIMAVSPTIPILQASSNTIIVTIVVSPLLSLMVCRSHTPRPIPPN